MLTLSVLPDGRLEIRHNGLILHALTAPESFVLAVNILILHAEGAAYDIATGQASGVRIELAGPPAGPAGPFVPVERGNVNGC